MLLLAELLRGEAGIKLNPCSVMYFPDGRCPLMNSICERNPCPEGTECLADLQEEKYTCVCDGSTATQCPGKVVSLNPLCLIQIDDLQF